MARSNPRFQGLQHPSCISVITKVASPCTRFSRFQTGRRYAYFHHGEIGIRVQVSYTQLAITHLLCHIRTSQHVSRRFQSGNLFLAGDAAHRFPPSGAFGMNTGIQDAHNLAWKLAAVLDGAAGPSLLDSYEVERKPVAEGNTALSVNNWKQAVQVPAGAAGFPLLDAANVVVSQFKFHCKRILSLVSRHSLR